MTTICSAKEEVIIAEWGGQPEINGALLRKRKLTPQFTLEWVKAPRKCPFEIKSSFAHATFAT